jgi:hypothetical protein
MSHVSGTQSCSPARLTFFGATDLNDGWSQSRNASMSILMIIPSKELFATLRKGSLSR